LNSVRLAQVADDLRRNMLELLERHREELIETNELGLKSLRN
jgi:hypothetical protein